MKKHIYARVSHPKYPTVIVPCYSPFAAIQEAARIWGCPWQSVLDAKVQAADQRRKGEQHDEA